LHEFQNGVFVGKIRSSEYRKKLKSTKPRKSVSVPDLTIMGAEGTALEVSTSSVQEVQGSSAKMYQSNVDMSLSTPALIKEDASYEESYCNGVPYFCYNGPPPVQTFKNNHQMAALYPTNQLMMCQNTFSTTDCQEQPVAQRERPFYGSTSFEQSASIQEHTSDPSCSCAFCVTLPAVSISPQPENLPEMLTASQDHSATTSYAGTSNNSTVFSTYGTQSIDTIFPVFVPICNPTETPLSQEDLYYQE
jgi:hypothetical protein